MSICLRCIMWGLSFWLLVSGVALGQVKLPDTSERGPNVSMDPFESIRAQAKSNLNRSPKAQASESTTNNQDEQNTTPNKSLLPPEPSDNSDVPPPPPATTEPENQDLAIPELAPQVDFTSDSSPPYSYTLFLDVDYINKFSGGASSDPMGDDPNMVPSPTAVVGLLHFYGEYDTAKADLWNNGTFVLHMIYGDGTSPTGTVGDLRSVSNIDASFMSEGQMVMPGLDLLELWYEHAFPLSQSSIRFGIGYLSSDFYKSKYTGLFLNSGFNSIGTEVLWNTMVSNPPNTTLGLWYKTKLSENLYGQAVVFDGFPDHSTKFFDLEFSREEGAFFATEMGWIEGAAKKAGYFKLGVGAWYLSQNIRQNMMIGVSGYEGDPIATQGYYTVIDKAINDNLGGFFKGGIAVNGINKYRHYFSLGVSYKGLIPSRPGDTAGVALVQSKLSDTYLEYHGTDDKGNPTSYSEETIYELTYSIPVNKWLMLQPDIQYVLQPGMSIMNESAVVGLIRAEITLL